jgi:hypothetical protein
VNAQRLCDDLAHRHTGIQRRIRVLEDELNLATELAKLAPGEIGDVVTPEGDFPVRGIEQARDAASHSGFTATRLPNNAKGLASFEGEIDPVHGLDLTDLSPDEPGLDREVLPQSLDSK